MCARQLLKMVDDITDAADICDSGTVLALDKAQREEIEDENAGLNEDMNDGDNVRMDSVLITQVQTVGDPINMALKSLSEKLLDSAHKASSVKHYIKVHAELLSDYKNNHDLISGAFPCLFPLGLTAEGLGGTGPMNKRRSRTLLLHKDRRFAEDRNYLLWSFDQRRRTEVNRSVSVKINSGDLRAARFEEIVNEEGFEEKLRLAVENKNSAEAVELKQTLIPLVQITGHNVRWSAMERKGTLGRLYAMCHFFHFHSYLARYHRQ